MDLESECSALESVEENEVVTPEILANGSETKIETNININTNNESPSHHELVDADTKAETAKVAESPNSPSQSPSGSTDSSPPVAPVKGYGLKKWRRIRREVNHDGGSNIDSSKILKRGLSNSQQNSRKPMLSTSEMRQKSEGSVASTNAFLKSPVGENGVAMGPIFAAGTDSENSEDRSSKSSTAASGPRMRYEVASMVGFAHDKGKMRNLGSKNLGNSVQQVNQKGRIDETSKKARGDRVKLEKENSHSSLESDSRSSNFVFMQGFNSVTSNGRQQSGRSVNYDGENSDEAQENFVGGSSKGIEEEKSENGGSSADRDPLLDYILNLQSVQEELEKEVQKLREIGKEDISLFDDSAKFSTLPSDFTFTDPKNHDSTASDSGENKSLETQMNILKNNIDLLKSKLDETKAALKTKEAKVVELEAALNITNNKDTAGGLTDIELEELFMQKIEAEVEYLAISRATQENGERKMSMMKNSGDIILGEDEILKMKRRVFKFSWCFLIQLILLVLLFGLLRKSPHSAEVVPT